MLCDLDDLDEFDELDVDDEDRLDDFDLDDPFEFDPLEFDPEFKRFNALELLLCGETFIMYHGNDSDGTVDCICVVQVFSCSVFFDVCFETSFSRFFSPLREYMAGSGTIDVVRVLMGLVMIGLGAYLFYKERNRKDNRRDWVVVVGVILMLVGAIYAFGIFLGSVLIADDMLDWFK